MGAAVVCPRPTKPGVNVAGVGRPAEAYPSAELAPPGAGERTMSRQGSRGILLVGTAVSLAVHAGLGAGFVRLGTAAAGDGAGTEPELTRVEIFLPPADPPEPAPPPEAVAAAPQPEPQPQPEPEPIRLGLERGSPEGEAWLGFEDQTDHAAPLGAVDQSAMTLEQSPGDGPLAAADAPPGPPQPPAEATPEEMPAQSEAQPLAQPPAPETEAVPATEAAPEPAAASEPETVQLEHAPEELPASASEDGTAETPAEGPAPVQILDLASDVLEAAERAGAAVRTALALAADAAAELAKRAPHAEQPPPPEPALEVRPAPVQQPEPVPSGGGGGGLGAGITSDRESIATAVRQAPAVRPGRVLATQGLEIQTRAPRWSYSTMMTRRPRNATVEIYFGPDGRVRRADFVRDGTTIYNSGSPDVDEPLLSAIYTWTARGKPIDELRARSAEMSAAGKDAPELRILITILFS
jgi:hypothetical protein